MIIGCFVVNIKGWAGMEANYFDWVVVGTKAVSLAIKWFIMGFFSVVGVLTAMNLLKVFDGGNNDEN